MNKSEKKFYNTAIKMDNALIELLEEKEFNHISVVDICKKAGVNRSTFYAHYISTLELLKEVRDSFVQNFVQGFSNHIDEFELCEEQAENYVSAKYIIPYLKFVKENKSIFKVFINNLNTFNADELYNNLLNKLWIPSCNKRGITDSSVVTYMSRFYLTGITSIIMDWINQNCEDDIFFICEVIILCIRPQSDFFKN